MSLRRDNYIRRKLGIPESDEPLPNPLYNSFEKPDKANGDLLYKPKFDSDFINLSALSTPWISYKFSFTTTGPPQSSPEKEDSAPFEVNLMEALVGWRNWKINGPRCCIESQNNFFGPTGADWYPNRPMVARCGNRSSHEPPAEFCSCGIYARDTLDRLLSDGYNGIYGQVYGWGRYVRGTEGWRAQYAYPKRFYITRDYARDVSPEIIDILKTYRVPIYMEQPNLFYDPKEDGYEHRQEDENWNFGADPDPDAEED